MTPGSGLQHGVALGGFMGVGKTSVGRRLAERLGLPFVDTDHELVAAHGPIADQIRTEGEATFRAREAHVVRALCDGQARVVATGGGVFADPELRQALRAHYRCVTLDVPLDGCLARVGGDPERPLLADAARLLATRRPHYADVDGLVDARGPVSSVVDELVRWLGVAREVPVALGSRSYPVVLRTGLRGLGAAVRRSTGARRVMLITDTNVRPLWAAAARQALAEGGVEVALVHALPAGESHKDLPTWAAALDAVLGAGLDRSTPVLALGGGVVGDVAGFVAATALRGVPFVQVPTTLLAMVDSSVGGKTGVNAAGGKNLVGAFHQPSLVWAALDTLETLPPRQRIAGLGEVVKTALVGEPDLFEALERDGAGDAAWLADVVARCVAVKAQVVSEDEREQGRRLVLNLGHSLGHALEAAAGFGQVLHGEAVGLGLVAEARLGVVRGLSDPGLPARIERVLARLGLPHRWPDVDRPTLHDALLLDKKRTQAMLRVPVPVAPGSIQIVLASADDLLACLNGA